MSDRTPDERPPSSPTRDLPRPPEDAPEGWAPRVAVPVTVTMLAGFAVVTVINVLTAGLGQAALIGFVLCLAVVFPLQTLHSLGHPRRWPARYRALTLSAQALATYLPFLWVGRSWGAMAGFMAGSLLLAVPGRVGWILYTVAAAGVLPAMASSGLTPVVVAYVFGFTLLTGIVVYGISSLSALIAELSSARDKLARMAVTRERLRVARDLHDLLGYSLSAITLKSELTHRLLPGNPHRAQEEITDILTVARQALADVRTVASGYRTMSLTGETDSAVSVLTAADIDVHATIDTPPLPPTLETILATVVREAITNILRHSKAQRATVRATLRDGVVHLAIANDGTEVDPGTEDAGDAGSRPLSAQAAPAPAVAHGNGLNNLAARLATAGGHLTTHTTRDGWFHLTVTAPAGDPPAQEQGQDQDTAPRPFPWRLLRPHPAGDAEDGRSSRWTLRLSVPLTAAVLVGYSFIMFVNVVDTGAHPPALVASTACLVAGLALQVAHSFGRPRGWPRWVCLLTLSAQAAVSYLPLLWIGRPWGSMVGFLAGSVLLAVRGELLRWVLYAVIVLGVLPLALADGVSPAYLVYLPVSGLLTGIVVYGMSSLSALVAELSSARDKLARMAVTRERLRVARDLHDLLGYSLSAITLKSELTHRLLPGNPHRAQEEITDILTVARQALADVRTVASGYRTMSLTGETDSAVSVLTAADIDVHATIDTPPLPPTLETILATVVREAITNILRHSKARHATIRATLRTTKRHPAVHLHIANDGLSTAHGDPLATGREAVPPAPHGNGLSNLIARLASADGHLTTHTTRDGWFHLTATAPLSPPDPSRPRAFTAEPPLDPSPER
ncbi:sensor histidine kinase [Sphaerisporangium aureirubrum]|uniref:Sensor histidine kinase n=1 Tax=Sphaerisporangium aureirubrum TaxID=1544736 RepID=A0ABW1NJN7_9ACTN